MGFGEAALAGGRRHHRQSRRLGQRDELVIALRDAHAVAGDHHRPLRGKQRLRGGGHARRIGRRRRGRADSSASDTAPAANPAATVPDSESMANSTATGPGCPASACLIASCVACTAAIGVMRLHHLLGDAAERAARIPTAVVARRLLIRRVQMERRRIGEIGQQQHRRTGQIRLHRADQAVAQHPRPLADHHARPPRQPAIDLGHHAGERFLAHQHHAQRVLVLAQARDDAAGVAAGDAEHVFDAGFLQHPPDQVGRRLFLGQHALDCHRCSSHGWLDHTPGSSRFHLAPRAGSAIVPAWRHCRTGFPA